MTDDHLASAYLDHEATPDERARVEADVELLAEVERLRDVRGQLADVGPPPISVREEHLASALSAWDRLPDSERLGAADARTSSAASPVAALSSRKSRRAWSMTPRWMGVAAAALILVVGAGVVLQQANSANDDSADGAFDADAAIELAERQSGQVDSEADVSGVVEDSADEATELAAEDIEAEADALSVLEEAGIDTNATPSASVDDLGPPSDGDVRELPVLRNTQDLVDFAAPAADAPVSEVPEEQVALTEAPAETEPAAEVSRSTILPDCDGLGIDVIVGLAAYVNYGPVMVGVDQDLRLAIAYDPQTCAPVETVSIP